jgi:hypothetical protein
MVRKVDGLKASTRRAVAFLSSAEDSELDAWDTFEKLSANRRREVYTRFDHWIDGGIRDNYFHGWPNNSRHKHCFTFKWKEKAQHHRLYGFLVHPLPLENPSFLVCVLVSHARKNEFETDGRELDRAISLRDDARVVEAINECFPDSKRSVL